MCKTLRNISEILNRLKSTSQRDRQTVKHNPRSEQPQKVSKHSSRFINEMKRNEMKQNLKTGGDKSNRTTLLKLVVVPTLFALDGY